MLQGPQKSHFNVNNSNLCFLNWHSKQSFVAKIGFTALEKKDKLFFRIFPVIDLWLLMLQPTIDEKIQLVPKAQLGSWGKGSSGGAKASETGEYGAPLSGAGTRSLSTLLPAHLHSHFITIWGKGL